MTPRQHEVWALLAQGQSNLQIAQLLSLTRNSVENIVHNIYSELELSGTTDISAMRVLAALAHQEYTREIA